jgi:hypothetical protein
MFSLSADFGRGLHVYMNLFTPHPTTPYYETFAHLKISHIYTGAHYAQAPPLGLGCTDRRKEARLRVCMTVVALVAVSSCYDSPVVTDQACSPWCTLRSRCSSGKCHGDTLLLRVCGRVLDRHPRPPSTQQRRGRTAVGAQLAPWAPVAHLFHPSHRSHLGLAGLQARFGMVRQGTAQHGTARQHTT